MRYGIIFSLVSALFAAGCGGEAGVATHPVKGKLTIGGKAIDGIQITFEPMTEGESASGNTQADGSYVLFTGVQGRPGAPAGKYRVVLADPGGTDYMDNPSGDTQPGAPDIKGRVPDGYTPKEVEVVAGENTIDIEA